MNRTLNRLATHGAALIAIVPLAFHPAMAQTAAPMSSSQSKMAECSRQNKGKKGDDYKKSQSDCLKGVDTTAAAPQTQQQKMAMCSKQNKGKKGDDYKKAQSDCLKA